MWPAYLNMLKKDKSMPFNLHGMNMCKTTGLNDQPVKCDLILLTFETNFILV